MTDHDCWLEDQREKTRKPNYTRRRILFAIVSIGLISSLTIMLTWHGGSTTAALMVDLLTLFYKHFSVACQLTKLI